MFRQATLFAVLISAPALAQLPPPSPPPAPLAPPAPLHVRLTDGSIVKVTLLDPHIDLTTPYGKLRVPVKDIRKIELGLHTPADVAKAIKDAITDLGATDYRKREAAMQTLLRHGEKSVPPVREATKSSDSEVVKRADDLLERLEAIVPAGRMNVPEHDVIYTDNSKFAGEVVGETLKARAFAFGDVQLRLSDAIAMAQDGFKEEGSDSSATLPDPGSLTGYQGPQHVGKTYVFQVTGALNGNVWGTEMYTLDSALSVAAVHMGIVKPGQSGRVKITILGPSVGFVGSVQNGVATSNYAQYPGAYKIHKK